MSENLPSLQFRVGLANFSTGGCFHLAALFYKYKSKYGGMEVSDVAKLRTLEDENAKLKRLLADAMLDNVVLKDLLGKN